ncbi:MAG: sodium/proline symporter [Acidobacteria bacterium]|nr:MAG: sodium/proline symporter [Acidobacteriota bacterium]REK04191.1 MAG: sodium/proline symporter [Acidobacteriota bacterium]REK15353.1 MAG: sodium/proline symporter [Acidobacteriota bacterium]REK46443.1 MAG: sodium/proline symporter [Acidobacteriota bacterium]
MNLSAIGFIAYLLALVLIGVLSARSSSEGVSSYFLAGRSLNRWVVALSAVASGRSAWLLLGFVGVAYTNGITAMWAAVGYITVECLMFFFYAPRLREYTEENDCITIPDFFAAKLGDPHGHLRGLLVLIIAVFMVAYVSAQFVAGGKAFFSSFGIDQTTGVFLTAAIILTYTILGGFVAVSKTDVIQAFCMLIALVVLPIVAIVNFGGWNTVAQAAVAWAPGGSFFDPWAAGAGAIIGWLGIGLGSPGNPHIVVRFMSIRKREDLWFAAFIGTFWNIVLAAGALLIGISAKAYFPFSDSLPGGDPEQAFPYLASEMLPPLLFGLIIAAIFSAIMSSADSQLLVAASGIVRDFYQKLWLSDEEIPEKKLVLLSRTVVAVLVILALIFGFFAEDVVFWLVLFAWAGLGATIGPTSLLAMFWRRTTRAGVMAGMITGGILVVCWKIVPYFRAEVWDMYELVPAFIGSAAATVIVSLATNKD